MIEITCRKQTADADGCHECMQPFEGRYYDLPNGLKICEDCIEVYAQEA